jgi:hypothetical protein
MLRPHHKNFSDLEAEFLHIVIFCYSMVYSLQWERPTEFIFFLGLQVGVLVTMTIIRLESLEWLLLSV